MSPKNRRASGTAEGQARPCGVFREAGGLLSSLQKLTPLRPDSHLVSTPASAHLPHRLAAWPLPHPAPRTGPSHWPPQWAKSQGPHTATTFLTSATLATTLPSDALLAKCFLGAFSHLSSCFALISFPPSLALPSGAL